MRVTIVLLLLLSATPARAQRTEQRFDAAQDTSVQTRSSWSVIRIAKWSMLVGSTAAVVYGFSENRAADDEYEKLEQFCQLVPANCTTGSNSYTDPALEARYQAVVRQDDRARLALLAGQVGLATSLLLFILDLPKGSTPEDIPYEPRPFQVGFVRDQVQFGFRLLLN